MRRANPHRIRPLLAFPVILASIVHVTVATPTAAAQAAKPDACELVDAAEMLRLTGREDVLMRAAILIAGVALPACKGGGYIDLIESHELNP